MSAADWGHDIHQKFNSKGIHMRKSIATPAFIAAVIIAMVSLAPVTASAREGAQSVGQGMKCYTAAVTQADGTVKYERVCYKGV